MASPSPTRAPARHGTGLVGSAPTGPTEQLFLVMMVLVPPPPAPAAGLGKQKLWAPDAWHVNPGGQLPAEPSQLCAQVYDWPSTDLHWSEAQSVSLEQASPS